MASVPRFGTLFLMLVAFPRGFADYQHASNSTPPRAEVCIDSTLHPGCHAALGASAQGLQPGEIRDEV